MFKLLLFLFFKWQSGWLTLGLESMQQCYIYTLFIVDNLAAHIILFPSYTPVFVYHY